MKLNRKLAIAGAAVLAVGALGFGTAEAAVTGSPVHHAAFFACISHNGAGSGTSVAGRPLACPAGSILAEGDHGTRGPAGPQGEAGAKGGTGPAGPAGTAGDILHNSHITTVPANSSGAVSFASCKQGPDGDAPNGDAAGYVALGGGFNIVSRDPGVYVSQSKNEPASGDYPNSAWQVVVNNTTDQAQQVQVWVICLAAPADNPAT